MIIFDFFKLVLLIIFVYLIYYYFNFSESSLEQKEKEKSLKELFEEENRKKIREKYFQDQLLSYDDFIKKEINNNYQDNNCVCVFDLDNTITCGLDTAKHVIQECKKNNCQIVVNTARTSPYIEDIQLDYLNLPKNIEIYYGDHDQHSFKNYNHLIEYIALKKKEHLDTISKKYNTKKSRIILFDDNETNIKTAQKYGYSVIHANHPMCGLNWNSINILNKILSPTSTIPL